MKKTLKQGLTVFALLFGHWAVADGGGGQPNIIVILADDYGKDAANLYYPATEAAEFPETAPTPALADLADNGILFTNAWAQPACTATRGTRSLGLYPSTTGIGTALGNATPRFGEPNTPYDGVEFPPYMVNPSDPNFVQRYAKAAGYNTYKVGKWHEAYFQNDPVIGVADVLTAGFDSYYGILGGIPSTGYGGGALPTPNWVPDSSIGATETNEFMTSALISQAIDYIQQSDGTPYYMALDFSAPHFPYEVAPGPDAPPPPENQDDWRTLDPVIHADVIAQVEAAYGGTYPTAGAGVPPGPNSTAQARAAFKSLIAYMDVQIARLMEHVDLSNTYVIFSGDNGTQGNIPGFPPWFGAVEPPWNVLKSKTTLYRNGYEVPFIMAGPGIHKPGRESNAAVNTADIYATVLDILGAEQPEHTVGQSFSFMGVLDGGDGIRRYNIAESWTPTPEVGGTVAAPGGYFAEDGRIVGTERFRLIARANFDDTNAYICRLDHLDPSRDCYNDEKGVYDKLISVEFYDLESDPFENDALVIEEMTDYQHTKFLKLCKIVNKISTNANYYQNGLDCMQDGSNLTDIDPL